MKPSLHSHIRHFLLPLMLVAAIFSLAADMTITLKDGRTITVPVDAADIASITFSDSSHAGMSGPAYPASLPVAGPSLWLDATDGLTLYPDVQGRSGNSEAGGPVALWKDKSGAGRNFVKPAHAEAPVLIRQGIGNLPSLQFTPAKVLMIRERFPAPVTILYVARMLKGQNARVLAATDSNWLLGYWQSFMQCAYYEGWLQSPATAIEFLPHQYTALIRGPGADSELWSDGKFLAGNQNGVTGPDGLSINGNPYGENSDCLVGEIIVYPRPLAPAERRSVEEYLIAKWKVGR